jgi:periplasmic glucans biosynthesis protein
VSDDCIQFRPTRRAVLALLGSSAAILGLGGLSGSATAQDMAQQPFSFESLTEEARQRAASPYVAPVPMVPEFVSSLDYDSYRLIQFKPEQVRPLDPDALFTLDAFHLGWLYNLPVHVFDVANGMATPIEFTPSDFNYWSPSLLEASAGAHFPGVAGFRIHYPLNGRPTDELVSFLGSSYFRALGRGNIYGLSARGLALNTWLNVPEEFPRFSDIYFETPAENGSVTLYAALDSQSVTGAYRFVITPGGPTTMDVTARLFFRAAVDELGVAPLTSMFLYAENNRSAFDDFRPQVHDSQGLFFERSTGETFWRPLNNPPSLANSYFGETGLKSFGLLQRDRAFESYQDAGAHYERRPSVLVEPQGDWGQGFVRLVEIPTKFEVEDNIVAFWVPEQKVEAGEEREFSYRLSWGDLPPDPAAPLAYVSETRSGRGGVAGVETAETLRKFVVEFTGAELDAIPATTQLDAFVNVSGGQLIGTTLAKLEANGHWRLVIDVEVPGTDVIELRAYLIGLGRKLTETWLYQWRATA